MASPHGVVAEAHRPPVMGRNGMVASGHPLASQAGVRALMAGGNAVDAAIATAAALGVVEPESSGIGGDGFITIYMADRKEVRCVNGTGPAPRGARRELFLKDGIPMKGILSVSVPGLVDGWLLAHERYGRLKLDRAFEPVYDLCENGFPVGHKLARCIRDERPAFAEIPTSRPIFTQDGRPLGPGEVLVQRDLGRTYLPTAGRSPHRRRGGRGLLPGGDHQGDGPVQRGPGGVAHGEGPGGLPRPMGRPDLHDLPAYRRQAGATRSTSSRPTPPATSCSRS